MKVGLPQPHESYEAIMLLPISATAADVAASLPID
jgi:hypothetical protein